MTNFLRDEENSFRVSSSYPVSFDLSPGKSVGLVTTTRITHATPGAAFAHIPFRDWESVTNMGNVTGCDKVKDIAYQLVMDNPNVQVILGGGRRSFLDDKTPDPRSGQINGNQRNDSLNLIEEWKKEKEGRGVSHTFVSTKGEFDAVDPDNIDYLMGKTEKAKRRRKRKISMERKKAKKRRRKISMERKKAKRRRRRRKISMAREKAKRRRKISMKRKKTKRRRRKMSMERKKTKRRRRRKISMEIKKAKRRRKRKISMERKRTQECRRGSIEGGAEKQIKKERRNRRLRI
ncbi:alkaline phosphatase [Elysia marginata]|uniref:alkaline phosphatase n=1 Tax=Elysia marginata TaxID=1093978 RepID=A0AAV4FD95_9GAST|nr:alkaline phosphatase [Elysia marginata]